jgi:hypothetical protein
VKVKGDGRIGEGLEMRGSAKEIFDLTTFAFGGASGASGAYSDGSW